MDSNVGMAMQKACNEEHTENERELHLQQLAASSTRHRGCFPPETIDGQELPAGWVRHRGCVPPTPPPTPPTIAMHDIPDAFDDDGSRSQWLQKQASLVPAAPVFTGLMPQVKDMEDQQSATSKKSKVHPFDREHFMCQGWKCHKTANVRSNSQVRAKNKPYKYWCHTCYRRYPHEDLPHDTHELDDDLLHSLEDEAKANNTNENQAASSSGIQCARKVEPDEDVHAQGLNVKDNYEVVFIWSSQHCQLERFHRKKTTTSDDDNNAWQHKHLQRGWARKKIWIDAKPEQFGYRNPHDGWWASHEVSTPSKRQQCINYGWNIREAYDAKLDACRKWYLTKAWRDWHKPLLFRKLLRGGLIEFFRQWHKAVYRMQCVRATQLRSRRSGLIEFFRQWHKALYRVQCVRASQLRSRLWHCLADKQMNTLTIVFHLWLRCVNIETMLCIMIQVGEFTEFLEVKMLFARWLQHVGNQTCDCIKNHSVSDVAECQKH